MQSFSKVSECKLFKKYSQKAICIAIWKFELLCKLKSGCSNNEGSLLESTGHHWMHWDGRTNLGSKTNQSLQYVELACHYPLCIHCIFSSMSESSSLREHRFIDSSRGLATGIPYLLYQKLVIDIVKLSF
jgi:hypothetical protein